MMNHTYGWMDGGMGGGIWIWTVIAVLVAVLLVVVINKLSNKKVVAANLEVTMNIGGLGSRARISQSWRQSPSGKSRSQITIGGLVRRNASIASPPVPVHCNSHLHGLMIRCNAARSSRVDSTAMSLERESAPFPKCSTSHCVRPCGVFAINDLPPFLYFPAFEARSQ